MKTQPWWVIICLLVLMPSAYGDGTVMKYPISARAMRVIDGDSIVISAHLWLNLYQETVLRLAHVDAPELRGKCPEEKVKAEEAKQFVRSWIEGSDTLTIHDVQPDKFGGRVVGCIVNERNENLGQLLLARGLARPYKGGRRDSWCVS